MLTTARSVRCARCFRALSGYLYTTLTWREIMAVVLCLRDVQLTRILRPAFDVYNHTAFITTLSASPRNADSASSTLELASSARWVALQRQALRRAESRGDLAHPDADALAAQVSAATRGMARQVQRARDVATAAATAHARQRVASERAEAAQARRALADELDARVLAAQRRALAQRDDGNRFVVLGLSVKVAARLGLPCCLQNNLLCVCVHASQPLPRASLRSSVAALAPCCWLRSAASSCGVLRGLGAACAPGPPGTKKARSQHAVATSLLRRQSWLGAKRMPLTL